MMKKIEFIAIMLLAIISCSKIDEGLDVKTFRALIQEDCQTKTYYASYDKLYWNNGDRIALFAGSEDKVEAEFTGEDGSREGEIVPLATSSSTGGAISNNVAIYPYSDDICYENGRFKLTLPQVQLYNPAFVLGPNTNTMIAASRDLEDNDLIFQNVCGYLQLDIQMGDNVQLSHIEIRGNNGERISGAGYVEKYYNSDPQLEMDDNASKVIKMTCEDIVFSGNGSFTFVVPPTVFEDGITANIFTTDGKMMTKTTHNKVEVTRNKISFMSSFDFVPNTLCIIDENFRNYCLSQFDYDSDGLLTEDEVSSVDVIECPSMNISTLAGIEFFPNLERLTCNDNSIESLDLTGNTKLKVVNCEYNNLSSIDVSKCSSLQFLSVNHNSLISLDVTNNTELDKLYCSENRIVTPDFTKNTKLTVLAGQTNCFGTIDLSNATELSVIDLTGAQLKSLDVTKCTKLKTLYCDRNDLSSLDVTNNPILEFLNCEFNTISSLDLSNNTELKKLTLYCNRLTELNLENNIKLTSLDCASNDLKELNVEKNTELTSLECYSNRLTGVLDVSHNLSLQKLSASSNRLSEIWLKTGQTIQTFTYDASVSIVYKD